MPIPFQRTLRALERERPGPCPPSLLAALLLLGGWGTWMVEARVPVYAVSQLGRLEVSTTPHRSAALTPGRVVQVFAELGQLVERGEALVQLDDTLERRHVEEARAELEAIELRIGALDAQRSVEERVREWQLRASEAALSQSRLALAEADQRSEYRRQHADIVSSLRRETLISETQAIEAAEQLSISRWQVSAAEASLEKERVASRYADEVQAAQLAGIARQLADLRAARLTARAALETAQAALERTIVRAPVAGRIGSMAALQAGDVAREGDVMATVIPDEHLKVMAEFSPAEAIGRVRQGQPAQIRLSGFSASEFGVLEAVVSRVASEPHAGTVRVELTLPPESHTRVPLQHGLPGSVEVCVEAAAPWRLLLRNLDRFTGGAPPRDASPTDTSQRAAQGGRARGSEAST